MTAASRIPMLFLYAALLLICPIALASGGGSSSNSMPSASAPQYDPALEFKNGVEAMKQEKFIRGLIVEEFDGPEPSKMTIDGLASYVRMLSPSACRIPAQQKIQLASYLSDARNAMQATQYAIDAKDPATARLMLASARSALGMIHERYAAAALVNDRELLHEADRELATIQHALDRGGDDISLRITTWLAKMQSWTKPLQRDESLSLFNAARLPAID